MVDGVAPEGRRQSRLDHEEACHVLDLSDGSFDEGVVVVLVRYGLVVLDLALVESVCQPLAVEHAVAVRAVLADLDAFAVLGLHAVLGLRGQRSGSTAVDRRYCPRRPVSDL